MQRLALVLFALCIASAPAHAEHRRVVTVEASGVSLESQGYNTWGVGRFALSEQVPLEGVSAILIETMVVTMKRETSAGLDSVEIGFALHGPEGEVLATDRGEHLRWGSERTGRLTLRMLHCGSIDDDGRCLPGGFEGTAAELGLAMRTVSESPGGTGVQSSLASLREDNTVRVHFVYGHWSFEHHDEPHSHVIREIPGVSPISLSGSQEVSGWESYQFDTPFSTEGLRLAIHGMSCASNMSSGRVMAESQLELDDGTFVSLDDSHSPSDGTVPDWSSCSNFLLGDREEMRAALRGRSVVGWRWRIHKTGFGTVTFTPGSPMRIGFVYDDTPRTGVDFQRGDANSDALLDVSDASSILGFLFLGSEAPDCMKAADANDSGTVDLSDAVAVLDFLFLGGAQPPDPHAACGADPTEDDLTCDAYPPCE